MSQDVRAFDFSSNGTLGSVGLVTTTDHGDVVKGLAQLAQRVAIELMTEKGSMLYLPKRGTSFLTQMRTGVFRSEQALLTSFAAAAVDLVNNLRSEENYGDDPDERIGTVALQRVSLDGVGGVSLTLKVYSKAGNAAVLSLPVLIKP